MFDVYEPRFEPYYAIRALDGKINSRAALQSVWLSGPSGSGKTCALKRYLAHQPGKHFHVCLSLHGENATRDDLIREFSETIAEVTGSETPAHDYNSLLAFLVKLDCGDIVIYVDEISTSRISNELVKLLYDMLVTWKQRTENRRLLIVVSSLDEPNGTLIPNKEKLHELFAFEHAHEWDPDELGQLCLIIINALGNNGIDNEQIEQIMGAAKGSPRFVKMVFRDLVFQAEHRNLPAALQRASEQLIK